MKNIVFAVGISLLVAACSSGTAVVEQPANVTSVFKGTFENTPGTQRGTVTLDLIDNGAGGITGNIIFESNGANCLRNGPIEGGTKTGFNISFTIQQAAQRFQITTRVEEVTTTQTFMDDGMGGETSETTSQTNTSESTRFANTGIPGTTTNVVTTGGDRVGDEIVTVVTTTTVTTSETAQSGVINVQLAESNGGSTLSGTYTTSSGGDVCSNATGSGTMVLNR